MSFRQPKTRGEREVRWTRQAIIEALQRWAQENGRTPTSEDWTKAGPYWPCRSRTTGGHSRKGKVWKPPFKTWAEAIEAAGLPPVVRQGGSSRAYPLRIERVPDGCWVVTGEVDKVLVRVLAGNYNEAVGIRQRELARLGWTPSRPTSKKDPRVLSSSERDKYGIVATCVYPTGRDVTFERQGTSTEALKAIVETCDLHDLKIRTLSSPNTIYADIAGLRTIPDGTNRRILRAATPERSLLGRLGRMDLLEGEVDVEGEDEHDEDESPPDPELEAELAA